MLDTVAPEQTKSKPKKKRRTNTINAWMIDRLFNAGIINEEQHMAGVHVRFWWECIMATGLRCISLEAADTIRSRSFSPEDLYTTRLSAQDLLNKINLAMHQRGHAECRLLWAPVVWVACDDLSLSQAAARLGKRKGAGIEQVKEALQACYDEMEGRNLLFWQRDCE